MGSLSITPISLRSLTPPQSSNLRKSISTPRPKHPSTQLPLLKSSASHLKIQSLPSLTPLPNPPHVSTSANITNTQANSPLLSSYVPKLAFLALGSVLSISTFSCRPSMAENSPKITPLEEKMNTEKESDGDEGSYMKILERNPRDVEALKMVLYGRMRRGEIDEAVKYAERLVDVEPKEVEWRLLQALSYEMMGQLGKAKRLFKEILKERPLLIRALHGLALVMHKSRESFAMFEMLNKALLLARREKRVIEERDILILIAQMHVVKGDLEGGLVQFKRLAQENPRDFRPFLCQGIIYSLLDNKQEADKQFEIFHALVPEEFPQRHFLDDIILSAKNELQENLEELRAEPLNKK